MPASSHPCLSSILPLAFSSNEMSNSDSFRWYLSHSFPYTHSTWFILLEPYLPQPAPCLNQFHVRLSLFLAHRSQGQWPYRNPVSIPSALLWHSAHNWHTENVYGIEIHGTEFWWGPWERHEQPGQSWGIIARKGRTCKRGPSQSTSV